MVHEGIFVLSCARSGSTLLRYMLDAHPEIACPAELHLGEACRALTHAALGTVGVVTGGDREVKRAAALSRVREIVGDLMAAYARTRGKRRWCEKSPKNLRRLTALTEVFPGSRCVCLHRHAMDVVASLLDFTRLSLFEELLPFCQRNNGNLIAAMVDYWVDSTRILLSFERENPGQCIRVSYEDLVSRPEESLDRVFEFLNVTPARIHRHAIFAAEHDTGAGDRKILFRKDIDDASVGRGRRIPVGNIPPELLAEMNQLLSQLGYPEVTVEWNAVPSQVRPDGYAGQVVDVARTTNIAAFMCGELADRLRTAGGPISGATCKVVLAGHTPSVWMVDMRQSSPLISNEDGDADCTVSLSADDFGEMAGGRLNPATAYSQGRLSIGGNFSLAVDFGRRVFGA